MFIRQIFANGKNFLSRKQDSILSAAFVLTIAFAFSAILGILRDRLLYARFYACCAPQLDAYNAAFRIPDILFRLLVVGALSAAFIPVFSEYLSQGKKRAYQLARTTMTLLLLVFFPLSFLVFIFSYQLSELITVNFSFEQLRLMSHLMRLMLFSQFFFLLSSFLTSILQVKRRFLLPALSPIVYNLGIIFGIQILSPTFHIYGPAIGVVIGSFLHFLIQLPLAKSLGFQLGFGFSFRRKGIKKVFSLMLPRSLSLLLSEAESTVMLSLATSLSSGSLSLFYLAQHLGQIPSRLFGATIGQAAFPALSELNSLKDKKGFRDLLLSSLLQSLYLTVLIALIILVLRVPIIRLAFGSKQFPWQATLKTGKILAFLSPAIVAQSGIHILVRGFYSLQNTRTPFLVSFVSILISITLAFLGIYRFNWDILSLVIATSVASFLQFWLLLFLISKKIENFPWGKFFLWSLKLLTTVFFSGVSFWFSMRFLDKVFDTTRVLGLLLLTLISLGVGNFIYFSLSSLLKISERKLLLSFFFFLKRQATLKNILAFSGRQIRKQKELIQPPASF